MKRYLVGFLFLCSIPTYAQHSVALKWNPSIGASTYNLYRGTVSGGPYTKVGNSGTTAYTDTTIVGGTTYYYVATAVNTNGESIFSNMTTAVVPVTPTTCGQGGANVPSISLSAVAGNNANTTATIWDNCPATVTVTATIKSDQPWLTVTPSSGTTAVKITVAASSAGLLAGTYKGNIISTSPSWTNASSIIPVTFIVAAPPAPPKGTCTKANPPVCTITGTQAGQSGTVTIQPGGTVVPWSRP